MQTSGSDRLINIEEYERLPDTNESVELLRGRLIREPRPAYGHGALQARLAHRLTEHIEQGKLPMVCGTDFGCRLTRNPDSVLAPDVAVARLFRDARWWRCTSRVPRPDSRFVHLVGRSRYGFGSVDRETGAGAGSPTTAPARSCSRYALPLPRRPCAVRGLAQYAITPVLPSAAPLPLPAAWLCARQQAGQSLPAPGT